MPPTRLRYAAAGLVASLAAFVFASPAGADPVNPIPGEGFFLVGSDISPGLYNTGGTASTFGVWINSTVKAFESHNCQPWTRVT
ncbi:hypothetical protein [Candidatus Mycolicibacterium alkanivorans]|uniref:Uncharacterized protein n=1 Tax=Candidatus Mycolicibacterium alkanivorans TaxID=2954114 RepID=A0ABS9Z094_9MYCO|nr:hypothetical protein [Candidatus Mycolicibacterium alkanivorans]MCI4676918.1 hypothetical protein [Candidatus Mycolicibacterium alkanivorans]